MPAIFRDDKVTFFSHTPVYYLITQQKKVASKFACGNAETLDDGNKSYVHSDFFM